MPEEIAKLSLGPTHCIAIWQNVLFQLWRGHLSVEPLQKTVQASFAIAEHFPGGVVPFSIIEENTAMPTSEVRGQANECWKQTRSNVRAVATVVEGSGFWVSAARAVITGITMVERGTAPQKAFSTTEDAIGWLERRHLLGDGNDGATLTRVLTQLRQQLAAQPKPD